MVVNIFRKEDVKNVNNKLVLTYLLSRYIISMKGSDKLVKAYNLYFEESEFKKLNKITQALNVTKKAFIMQAIKEKIEREEEEHE